MNKAYTTITAVALAAALAAPVSAQQLPLNNTVSGGQGEATVDGGGLFAILGGLGGAAGLAAIAALVVGVGVIALDDDDTTSTTGT